MKLRPCIDIHNGKVKQIVGSTLSDKGDIASENFVSDKGSEYYARMYAKLGLKGGHIILLNSVDSPYYEKTREHGIRALMAEPGLMQIGGGINDENAADFIEAGASHIIVTSFVFKGGQIDFGNLKKLLNAVGKDRIVLDLSCKKRGGAYYIVTDRWQKFTDVVLCEKTMEELSCYCDEFLIHAADVEGKQNGIEEDVAEILSSWGRIPITYAGGIKNVSDILKLKQIGKGMIDVTVGSALDIFGGDLSLEDAMSAVK